MQKVLIITYYWPPAGGPGVQRWLKFVKYFREFGIEPIVYVPENPTYPMTDTSFAAEIPEGITMLRHRIFEPYALAGLLSKKKTNQISSGLIPSKKQSLAERIMLWIRGNCFIPDARKYWVNPSVSYLSNYLKEHPVTTIITTGPPHSLHLIGKELQLRTGIPWLADFRDPWTSIGYHSKLKLTKTSQAKHKAMELSVLQQASMITVTSYTTQKEFEVLTKKPVHVVTNGFDVTTIKRPPLAAKFRLAHIGSLLSGRNPEALWRALQALMKEVPEFAADLELVLAGKISEEILQTITTYGLDTVLHLPGYLSHEAALTLQRSSQVNLLIEINTSETQGIIPGKLFEYMAAERPILAIGPPEWDAATIVKKTNTGSSFLYSDVVAIKKQLLSWYHDYKKDKLHVYPIGLQQFSRKALTQKMAALLASMH